MAVIFSIGLPITKTEFLKETLDSLQKQDFLNYELIIRNNAASKSQRDCVKDFCKEWIKKPNVKYFESETQLNISENFNKIIEEASGDYFTILSDDDILHARYLSEFYSLICKFPDLNLFHCRVKLINEKNELIDFTENCPEFESQADFIFNRLKSQRSLYLSDFVYRVDAMRNINGFKIMPLGWGIDELAYFQLCETGLAFTSNVLLEYRVAQNNFSSNHLNFEKRFEDIEITYNEIEKILAPHDFYTNSAYPKSFLQLKNRERNQKLKGSCVKAYAQNASLTQLFIFFFRNRSKYKIPMSAFLIALTKKILKV